MTTSTSTTSATTSFTSGSINVSGLGNGTDFNSLIDGLITAESATKKSMESWKAQWQLKVEGFQYLNKKLLALKTTLGSMDTVNEFLTKSVSSTSDNVSAKATSDAIEGSHTIIVGQLAQNDILTTASGVSALTSVVTTSTTNLSFSYAGQTYTISNIGAGSTLTNLVNYINNNAGTKDKVRATTIYDGTTYHLQLYGMDQGAGNKVVLSNTGALVFGSSSFQNTQKAQSSMVKVDGYPVGSANWISRNSNTVDDVIPGISLTLKQANSNATIQIGVTTDAKAIKESIKTFIDAVNEVRSALQALTKVSNSSGTATGSLLTGNYGVQLIGTQLKDVVTDMGVGFNAFNSSTGEGDYYSALSQLGISTDADQSSSTYGKLILDETQLDAALTKDSGGVAKLFSADYAGESESQDFSYLSRINGKTKAGSYNVKVITSATGISSATINGLPAGIDGWKVTGLTGDAAGLVVQVDNHTANSTFSGTVDIKLGKTGQMVEKLSELTNSTTGPLAILEDNYGEIMDSIDAKITREDQRLTNLKNTLKAKYARLDKLLSTLTSTQNQLTSTITQLSK
ncbi:MAG TPA: flagellar filament capping protein FliD [Humidesulfovibrio sp.]|uniref:flagellar filament capping protein FliD n=1 Tax=Humidesulfovibrio sp. TaxID=2910988 RepID=UPI002B86960F|nr:flagellar filament capping protein FliD [Humidesulfovibrio sp.]HWR04954.1 flagellar filament capping protein FliD [Humidesulfovibrio sp.]